MPRRANKAAKSIPTKEIGQEIHSKDNLESLYKLSKKYFDIFALKTPPYVVEELKEYLVQTEEGLSKLQKAEICTLCQMILIYRNLYNFWHMLGRINNGRRLNDQDQYEKISESLSSTRDIELKKTQFEEIVIHQFFEIGRTFNETIWDDPDINLIRKDLERIKNAVINGDILANKLNDLLQQIKLLDGVEKNNKGIAFLDLPNGQVFAFLAELIPHIQNSPVPVPMKEFVRESNS